MLDIRDINHAHIFCGLGSGAKGFNGGQARVGNMVARFRCVGGIDVDPAGIRDFERMTGVNGTVRDLFSLEQYIAFHGREPPKGWRPATPADVRASFTAKPHILFLSAPCKGFSGLLSETNSKTAKYQALNELTVRGMWLFLEAYADDPVELIIFENVPRIATRGSALLDSIDGMLKHYGYVTADTTHDCGELGGLAQSRKRFLKVARHAAKIPPYLYEPPKRRLRGVGEILDRMPLPGDLRAGPMHRVPALQWQTWVRLAFVEAGSDWRSLNKLHIADGVLRDFGIAPEPMRNAGLGVVAYDQPVGAVIGESFPTNGRFAVADPRAEGAAWNSDVLGVREWAEPTGTVAGRSSPTNGAFSVADPRDELWGGGQAGVVGWEEHAPTITSQRSPLQGAFSVADPRVDGHAKSVQLGVRPWDQPAAVVKGDVSVGTGPYAVADPRVGEAGPRFNNVFRIVAWDGVSPAVTGGGGNSAAAVADPRPAEHANYQQVKYRVTEMREPAGAVIAASTTGNGAFAVADPRTDWPAETHSNKLKVIDYETASPSVIGTDRGPGSGAISVADPRPRCLNAEGREGYVSQGHYGVTGWDETAKAIPAFAKNNNGSWSVADPRKPDEHFAENANCLPSAKDRLVCVIRSLDDTWHRPFTTLELAALQSFFDPEEAFGFELDGKSDSAWRERIGNAVPSAAAAAIASTMGQTLLLAWSGESFMLSSSPIWVQPNLGLQIALAVDIPDLENC
jgi:site-specific DNA-cytosine methylase